MDPAGLEDLSRATHLVQTVAPIADFDRDPLLALHSETLQSSNHLQWVGYLSSTGVYGDYDGEAFDCFIGGVSLKRTEHWASSSNIPRSFMAKAIKK